MLRTLILLKATLILLKGHRAELLNPLLSMSRAAWVIFLKQKVTTCPTPDYPTASIHTYYKMQSSYHSPKVLSDLSFDMFLSSAAATHFPITLAFSPFLKQIKLMTTSVPLHCCSLCLWMTNSLTLSKSLFRCNLFKIVRFKKLLKLKF